MVVKRVQDLNIRSRGFITAIIGNTDDVFIDNDLCRYSFEEQLYLYLKNEGYKRIFFYNRARNFCLYTFDNKVILEQLFPSNSGKSNNQDGRPHGGRRLLRNSNTDNDGGNSNIKQSKVGNRQYYYVNNFQDVALTKAILDILNNEDGDSIIYFSSTKIDFNDDQGLIAGIESIMKGAAKIQSNNKILVHYSARDTSSFLNNLNHPYTQGVFNNDIFINQFKSGDQLLNEYYFNVELPDEEECRNWLNSKRIEGIIDNNSIFSFPYKTLIYQIYKDRLTIKSLEIKLGSKPSNTSEFLDSHRVEEFSEELLSRALSKIHGQQDNMKVITKKVVTWVHRPDKAKKPLVFMFAGTSGTGKTYTAETITECLKSQGYEFVKLPMNEYKSEADTWKLLGSATGYSGSSTDAPLFAARKKSEKLVILFDEMEKAHSSIFETIMTLMEKGELTNGRGEKYDFRNSIIIFTSNVAMNTLIERKKELLDAGSKIDSYVFQQSIKDILKQNGIKNEICGRINLVFVYNTLGIDVVSKIIIEEIRKLGRIYGLEINNISEGLLRDIATQVADNNEGARPITTIITNRFEETFQNLTKQH